MMEIPLHAGLTYLLSARRHLLGPVCGQISEDFCPIDLLTGRVLPD